MMSWVIPQIKEAFDELAPDLFTKGRGTATLRIHQEVENLAPLYAATSELGFSDDYPESAEGSCDRTLMVFRECRKGTRVFGSTQGEFLYDHCWMVFYNDLATDEMEGTGEPLVGYLSHCELVMEVEFDFAENVLPYRQDLFHRDFHKLVLARAPLKIFVFQSRTAIECDLTMKKLETQIRCMQESRTSADYLLSCWCQGEFVHREFTGK